MVLDVDHVTSLNDILTPAELGGLLERGEAQLTNVIAALQGAWRRQDVVETRRTAHTLVGLAGSIGCKALVLAARSLETGTEARIPALLDRVLRLVPPTIDALHRWRASAAAGS
ncbi:MAG TPA: Hpt domain-containing protein [Alphaproteobacteria bacterium]|nr:Hpt domain-containing protein [Alphaproteobacteria bacterium]